MGSLVRAQEGEQNKTRYATPRNSAGQAGRVFLCPTGGEVYPDATKWNWEAQEGKEAVRRGGLDQEAIGFRSASSA